jgi:hypothetical protein
MSTSRELQNMSPEDQLTFDGWVRANAVVGSIFAIGMLAMAVMGSNSATRPDTSGSLNITDARPASTAPLQTDSWY